MSKVFLALIDGMRPDSLTTCDHPFFRELLQTSRYSMNMQTIMPSVTLPCHMSLFHGVCAERHGILTNTYVPQVRPVNGICEHLAASGKSCAFFYTWEPLKDLSRPQSLARANYYSGKLHSFEKADALVTDDAERMFQAGDTPDFIFFYQCNVDEVGHKYGWMSEEYIASVKGALDNVQRIVKQLPEEYRVIVTADHGGHSRSHGTDMPEDMTTPFFLCHNTIEKGEISGTPGILDIAPTVAACLGLDPDPDWEGKSLL